MPIFSGFLSAPNSYAPENRAMRIPPLSFAAVLLLSASCGEQASVVPVDDLPRGGHVLLISIDTLRADALSSYGNVQVTSPVLDAMAADGIRFEEVLTQAANTATSHATLFTGAYPWTHRVSNVSKGDESFYSLPTDFTTLAESYAMKGYATAAFTDGGPFSPKWNLMQGFDHHENMLEGVAAKIDQLFVHLDETADEERSRFLFLHTYEVHQPYLPPVEWTQRFRSNPDYDGPLVQAERKAREYIDKRGRKSLRGRELVEDSRQFTKADTEYLWDMYLGAVAYTDYQMGLLFDGLRERDLYDDTLIIVTSDHGEEFGEHGYYGHSQVYRETLSVPLIIKLPKGSPEAWRGTVVPERVSQVDVHASLMDFANVPSPYGVGYSLFEGLRTGTFPERTSFAETTEGFNAQEVVGFTRLSRSAHAGNSAVMLSQGREGDHHHLLDLTDAPRVGQRAGKPILTDLVMEDGESKLTGDLTRLDELHGLVEQVLVHLHAAAEDRKVIVKDLALLRSNSIDEGTRAEMEALGYLDSEDE